MLNSEKSIARRTARNYGIDLLRNLAMFMVLILHVTNFGIFGNRNFIFEKNQFLITILYYTSFCAVNCFGTISGFVGINAHYNWKKFLRLYLVVAFYSIGITALIELFTDHVLSSYDWLNAFFPVFRVQYWYFSAYAVLFVFIPILNVSLHKLPYSQARNLIWISLLFFSVIDAFPLFNNFDKDIFKSGFNGVWLCVLYFIGGFCSLHGIHSLFPLSVMRIFQSTNLFIRNLMLILVFLLCIFSCNIYPLVCNFIKPNCNLAIFSYVNILIIIPALIVLYYCSKLCLPARFCQVIKFFTPMAFSVYLIHTHPLIYRYFFNNRFQEFASLSQIKIIIAILIISVLIYITCSLIDWLRIKLFASINFSYNFLMKLTHIK